MESEFAYDATTTYNSEITISDVQCTCIEAIDNQGTVSYLLIDTVLGTTFTIEAGPMVPDSSELPNYSSIIFMQYEASEYKSKKQIAKFFQPKDKGKRKVIEVKEIPFEEAIDIIKPVYNCNISNFIK